jgi:HSP20 family protein
MAVAISNTGAGNQNFRRRRSGSRRPEMGGTDMSDLMIRDPSRLFRDLWGDLDTWFDWRPTRGDRRWMPAVDVKETDKTYVLEADLPGMTDRDVDVRIEGDTLTLSSHKEEEREDNREGYLRRERYSRRFQRSFRLPEDVDRDKIEAKFQNGVLTLNMPRTGASRERGRKIAIKSG